MWKSTVLEEGGLAAPKSPLTAERQAVIGKPLPPAPPVRPAPTTLVDALPPRPGREYRIFADGVALIDAQSRNVVDIVRNVF